MEKETIIAKGIYKHPIQEHFISVKQYMFVQRDGKKYLLLRCANDISASVDSVKFILTEINSDGEVISTRRIEQSGIRAERGSTFAPSTGIPISDACMDFKIKFIEARSDAYTYRQRGRRVCVYYTPKSPSRARPPIGTAELSVKKNKKPRSRFAAWLTVILVSLFIGASVFLSYMSYMEDYNSRKKRERSRETSYCYDIQEHSAY